MTHDLRYALRALARTPGFTLTAMLTLALGVGANTSLFTLVNAVLVRPLPFTDSERLVRISLDNPGLALGDVPFSFPEFDDLRTRANAFDEVSVVFPASANLTGAKEPERLELLGVSPNYFSMLGARAELGRLFGPEDVARGFAQAVVISDAVWRRAYGADPNVLGRTLRLDNDMYVVVGVVERGFRHPGPTVAGDIDVWATAGFAADPFPIARNVRILPGAIGRLRPGLTLAQAEARLEGFAADVRRDYPSDYPAQARWSVRVQPLQVALVGDVRPMLLVLMAAVVLIVLIAAVNIASLQLARASGRQREMSVRLALGASGFQLMRQLLVESLTLSLAAGAIGVAAAAASLTLVVEHLPASIPRLHEVRIDGVVLMASLGLSIAAGILSGLAPALQALNPHLVIGQGAGSARTGQSLRTHRLRGLLVASELALAVVLLVGAGLLFKTLARLLDQPTGFNAHQVVSANIWLPVPNDPQTDKYAAGPVRISFAREVLRRIGSIPGVERAALTSSLPMTTAPATVPLAIEGRPVDAGSALTVELIGVTPEYFQVMQVPIVRGRALAEADSERGQFVVLVDETTARLYWGGDDPVGRRLRVGPPAAPWLTVVGVAGDVRHDGLDRDGVPHIYTPFYQRPGRAFSVAMRTGLPASAIESQVRQAVQRVDPELPVFGVRAMSDAIDRSLARRRFSATLAAALAGAALLVTSIGIYGLLAYLVAQRRRELGVRLALGAQRGAITRLVLWHGLRVAGAGLAAGLVVAASAAPVMRSVLYGVQPIDPMVFLAVPAVLLGVTLLASYIPVRRATRVDPAIALRAE